MEEWIEGSVKRGGTGVFSENNSKSPAESLRKKDRQREGGAAIQ